MTQITNHGLNVRALGGEEVCMRDQMSLLQQLHLDGYRVDKVSLTLQTQPVAASAEQLASHHK